MNTNVFTFNKDGEVYTFQDRQGSDTVPYVWNEFTNDFYGLNNIKLSDKDVVIDIGANVGMFSIYVKKRFGCRVISFEPVLENFENFKKNIYLNGLKESDFELHHSAITNVDGGEIFITSPGKNSGGSSIYEIDGYRTACKTERINKYLDNCTYLKIDCEGGEYDIIPNILNHLNDVKFIGIEYHSYNTNQDAIGLHNLICSNFNGQIFSNIEDKYASWNLK